MASQKAFQLWLVNVLSFLLFFLLAVTGLINWLFLPRGPGIRETFLYSLRHFLISVHEWLGLMFIVVIAVHLALHWPYIKNNLQKYGIIKS